MQEIAALFGLHKNAVGGWRKSGLQSIDRTRPTLIHGSDLIAYLSQRQKSRRASCQPNELYCFRCRAPRQALGGMVDIEARDAKRVNLIALCAMCSTTMQRVGSVKKLALYCESFESVRLPPPHLYETPNPSLKCALKGECHDG